MAGLLTPVIAPILPSLPASPARVGPALGEVGMAFVVTRSGDPEAAGAILAWCRDQMANYKVPRAIEILDELPLNATGKVEKLALKARVAGPAE